MNTERTRIESELEVQAYLQNLRYALTHKARVEIQLDRRVDEGKKIQYTNRYTLADLFGGAPLTDVMRKELQKLTVEEYMRTVKDLRHPDRDDMREFGKVYKGKGDVYIKIRVDLLAEFGNHKPTLCLSTMPRLPSHRRCFPTGESKEVNNDGSS